jgi:hypothetical protein
MKSVVMLEEEIQSRASLHGSIDGTLHRALPSATRVAAVAPREQGDIACRDPLEGTRSAIELEHRVS